MKNGWLMWDLAAALGVIGFVACGGGDLISSDSSGVRTAGLVREIECDGDEATLTIEGGEDSVEVAITPSSVGAEAAASECDGLGRMLGLEVDVVAQVQEDGSLLAEHVEPLEG